MLMSYRTTVRNNSVMNFLKQIQLEAGRFVTGATKLIEIDTLYKEHGWLKFSERGDRHNFFLFFKLNHCISPLYLSNLLPLHFGCYHLIDFIMLKTM